MSHILIRNLLITDLAQLSKLHQSITEELKRTTPLILNDSEPDGETQLRDFLENTKNLCLGAFEKDKMIGYVIAILESYPDPYIPSPYFNLTYIGLSKAYRQQGIAMKLMDSLQVEVKKRGVLTLELRTHVKNIPAQKFFEKAGFQLLELRYVHRLEK